MDKIKELDRSDAVEAYDDEAEASNWLGPEHTHSGTSVTMYRHSEEQIKILLEQNDFDLKRSLEFPVPMDRKKSRIFKAKAYVVSKKNS